jgi:hypothetical protein
VRTSKRLMLPIRVISKKIHQTLNPKDKQDIEFGCNAQTEGEASCFAIGDQLEFIVDSGCMDHMIPCSKH